MKRKHIEVSIPTTFLAGHDNSGKTEILKILRLLADSDPHYPAFDMNDVITWHRNRPHTKLGSRFISHIRDRKQKDLPDEIRMIGAVKFINYLPVKPKHCVFAGAIKNIIQAKFAISKFWEPKIVVISCTREESGVLFFARRINQLRNDSVLPLERSQSMREKMEAIIRFVEIPETTRNVWRRNANNTAHPAGKRIFFMDHPETAHEEPLMMPINDQYSHQWIAPHLPIPEGGASSPLQ